MKKGIDFIGVGAGSIIFNNEGKVFIAQRGPKARNEKGKWDFPGGSVKFGETCQNAVIREIKEEFDMEIEVIELLEVNNHILLEEKQHWVSPSFISKHVKGSAKIVEPEKCLGFKWVKLSEINQGDLTSVSRSNYKKFIEKYDIDKVF
ncbi:MAG: NUDIX domain-containing protein [Parachlamydiales bacterium]|nr:NUDIX domain-containing protein [Parachlamydiales bacterium]